MFSKPEFHLNQYFCLLELFWNTVDMSLSHLINSLSYSSWLIPCCQLRLLQSFRLVFFYFGQDQFCTSGHAQLCQLFHGIHSDMSNVCHSLAHLFVLFTFCFQLYTSFRECLSCNKIWFLAVPSSWCGYLYRCYAQSLGLLFQGSTFIL